MRFGLLGPLLVQSGEENLPVRRGKQRTVLAALLLDAGRVVSVEKLIDVIWGENPPASADVAVRNYVMRLRRDLGSAKNRIRTEPPGYLISVADEELDVSRYEALLGSARTAAEAGSWEAAASEAAAALALWRGEALCDVESDVLAQRETPRLTELRLRGLETRIEADLNLGRHAEVVAELEHLTAAHPLRENPRAQLMLALYRGGRQAEAMAVYRSARQALIDALGTEPGEALRDLHQRIIFGDPGLAVPVPAPAPGPIPRQLPWATRHFVGRSRELAALSGLLRPEDGQPSGSVVISAIGGTAGVGKTALALQWAHQVSGEFPDGQLYVNLRGYDPDQPVAAADALAGFLHALGLPGERIPSGTDARAAAFRSLLAGRRVLILLDNACEAEQVRPLLPGSSSCLTVVTSRDALAGLVARDGAVRLDLGLLPLADAMRLMRDLVGERAAAEPDALERLAAGCCRLPLALRVAAELAISRPGTPLADLAAELTDQRRRLDLLDAGGDPWTEVRAVFSWSYDYLDSQAALVFRLIGLHPGPDCDAYAAAALAGISVPEAGACLDRLARASLVQPAGLGRSGLHDLLRDYARELAVGTDGENGCRAALTRLFDYYVRMSATAGDVFAPGVMRHRFAIPESPVGLPPVGDAVEAQAWLDAERDNLVATSVHGADHGWPVHATTLSSVLYWYLHAGTYLGEAQAVHAGACRAARACGDRAAEARALTNLAGLASRQDQIPEAADLHRQALAVHREVGDRFGEARALTNLAMLGWRLGRTDESLRFQEEALAMHREMDDRIGEACALGNLGNLSFRLSRFTEAVGFLEDAVRLYCEVGERYGEAHALKDLASGYEQAGQAEAAADYSQRALALLREINDRNGEADVVTVMARIRWRTGRRQDAYEHVRRALDLYREAGDRFGEAQALNTLGDFLRGSGEPAAARVQHDAALSLAVEKGDLYEQARALEGLGSAAEDLGDLVQASVHWDRARVLYAETGAPEAAEPRSSAVAP